MNQGKRKFVPCLILAMLGILMLVACGETKTSQATTFEACDYEVSLPASYETAERNYPVVYVLPQDGYAADDSGITEKLNQAMADGMATEMIIVRPIFKNDADIHGVMSALVAEVDASYRTIADKNYRAVIGTGTGGYLAYILGLTEGSAGAISTLKEANLFANIASIRGDFVSEQNPWYETYGDVYTYVKEMQSTNETVFEGFYTYMDAPVADAWSDMEGSTNDLGSLFIGFGTTSAAHEFTARTGEFNEEFLTESVNRAANRLTNKMLANVAFGTVKLEKATLPENEKNATAIYSLAAAETFALFGADEVSVDVIVAVVDSTTGETLAEAQTAVAVTGAGNYEGELFVENAVNGSSSDVQLSARIFGAAIDLGSTVLTRSEEPVIDGDYQKINLAGDWYFNYVGEKKTIDVVALTPQEYETWSVVQPGIGNWEKGYGNISDENVNSMMGDEYFNYMIVGSGYYVKDFEVPENFDSIELILSVGYIDDRCEVFLNGERVGATGMDENGKPTGETTWALYSNYEVDASLLKRGEVNTIVVRAWNDTPYGAGGWYGGPIGLYSQTAFDNQSGAASEEERFYEATFESAYAASGLGESGTEENEYLIYLPEGYAESDRYYPTVYLLHQFNSDHTSYRTDKVNQLLDEAIAAGMFDEMIVVIPNSAEESWWTGDWEKMITEELIPLIDAKYRTIKDARYRLTAGCSMGGQGAYAVALRNPDYFTGAVSFFGAFSYGGDNSPNNIAAQESAEYMDYYTMYFICGNQDSYGFGTPAIELHQVLNEKGIEHGFFIENGGHDSAFYVPYFNEAFAYTRSNMYQSNEAVDALLFGTLDIDTTSGVKTEAQFEALAGIEDYYHTIPDSAYTVNANPDLSIPLIVEVVQDGKVVHTQVERDYVVNAQNMTASFQYDLTEYVDTAKNYDIVFKAAIFDRVVVLDTFTMTVDTK